MNTRTLHSMCLAGSMVAVISLSACTGNSHKTRADMAQAELDALQQAFGEEELTPDAITALRTMITSLMGRADISPEALQALRDQVDSLTGRADISPEALQALRDQVDSLMGRADISPEALQALRDQVDSLTDRADISPEALQALRDQVDSLTDRADISPEALQALRDQIDSLMGRADISPETLQALRDQVDSLMGRMEALFAATVPEGLTRSTAPPVEVQNASDTLATLLPDPANLFAPLAALFRGDSSEQSPGSELASDLRVKTVSSDGNDGFRVTYVAGGEEQTIHFEAADYVDGRWHYAKVTDGVTYFLGTHTGSFERASKNQGPSGYRHFDQNQFGISDEDAGTIERGYMSYGARTDTSGLPAGEATYIGSMEADTYRKDNPSTAQRERMRGDMRLTAEFDAGTLDGIILGIRVRRADESDYSRLPDTTWFEIGNGRIVDGQLVATLTGMDSNAAAPMDDTVRGYEGGILGELYGPAAEEAGGVLNASRSNRVMVGMFGGRRPDPGTHTRLHRSTAAPVFATQGGGDIEDLFDSSAVLAPLTSTLETIGRHRPTSVIRSGDTYVKSISSDGNDGIHVTYVVGGEEQTIHYLPEDYIEDEGYWTKKSGPGPDLWFWAPGDYYFLGGLWIGLPDGNLRPSWTAGARTDVADLPAGTATYIGGMGAESFSQVDGTSIVRYSLRGDLSLTADFDASTLAGEITNMRKRWRLPEPRVWIDLPDTSRFDIGDGQIADGQFTATLTGVDTNESASLHDSVRGYEGDVLGEFYGPAAEEIGGVISATRDADLRVMSGTIRGHQQ